MWSVLPLKDFVSAKQRLSGVLSAAERHRLFHAMVEDVLSVLTQAPSIDGTVIVSARQCGVGRAAHHVHEAAVGATPGCPGEVRLPEKRRRAHPALEECA